MSTSTLVPVAQWASFGTFVVTGAANAVAALSDGSDASFVKKSSSLTTDQMAFQMTPFTPASTDVIQSIQFTVRHMRPSVNSHLLLQLTIGGTVVGSYAWGAAQFGAAGAATIYNFVSPVYDLNTRHWSTADLQNIVIRVIDAGTSGAVGCTFYDISAVVTTNTQPVVTVTAPSGTVTDTTMPLTSWTYVDADGDIPLYYSIKIFSSSVYGGAGFDPEVSTPVQQSGVQPGTPTGAYCGLGSDGLPNAAGITVPGTYRSYVKVAQYVGPYLFWSLWSFSGAWTLAVSPPNLGTLSGGWLPASAACTVQVVGHTNMLTQNDASLETSVGNWVSDVNATVARSTAQAQAGAASLGVTSVAAGTMSAVLANTSAGRIPILANTVAYTAMASFRAAATGRSCAVGVRWLNSSNVIIQTDFSPTITSLTTGWTTAQFGFTPPSNATSAIVVAQIQSTAGASEVHYVDEIAFYPGVANAFQNLAPNPSVEVDLTGWANFFGDPNITIAQSAVRAFSGTKSILCSVINAATSVAFGSSVYNLTIGVTYTASIYVWNDVTHPVPSINLQIPFLQSGTSTTTTGAWTRLTVTWVATATSAFVTLQATGTLASPMIFYADALQVEVGSTASVFTVPTGAWTPGGYSNMIAQIERSNDGGNTWTQVYGGPFALPTTTQTVTITDYEATRGTVLVGGTPEYRVKILAINPSNGLTISSDYTSPVVINTTNDGQWWLKSLAAPNLNIAGLRVRGPISYDRPEEAGVFYPLGGSGNAVVVHGSLHGENGSLSVLGLSATEWTNLEALIQRQDTIVLQDPVGETKRIQWTNRTRNLSGTTPNPQHAFALDYVAVD